MKRSCPQPPPNVQPREDDRIHQIRRYKVITPLFGGGVDPQQADPISVVRATEVRGQLRFWWRACKAGGHDTVASLKKSEGEIWGSTEKESRVQISIPINSLEQGKQETAFQVVDSKGKAKVQASGFIAPYAAFPLLPNKDQQRQIGWQSQPVRINVAFSLELRYPQELKKEVEAALWAWETFGGLGARTRRGFGALSEQTRVEELPRNPESVEKWLKENLQTHVIVSQSQQCTPTLHHQMQFKVIKRRDKPIAIWKYLVETLFKFRQARYDSAYGLSKWPEANAIRKLHGLSPKFPEEGTPRRIIEAFPRAAFGLPINFHMSHDPSIRDDAVLQGKGYDRLASRLILRPLACANGRAVGLAAVLNGPSEPLDGLTLQNAPNNPSVSADLTQEETDQIPPLDGNTDVLEAFLNWL